MKLFSILYVLEKRSIFNPKITAVGVEKKRKKPQKNFPSIYASYLWYHIYDFCNKD